MKSYRFEITYKCIDESSRRIMVNIPLDALKEGGDNFSTSAREWIRNEKGIDCTFARYRGYSYTTEDLTKARKSR